MHNKDGPDITYFECPEDHDEQPEAALGSNAHTVDKQDSSRVPQHAAMGRELQRGASKECEKTINCKVSQSNPECLKVVT